MLLQATPASARFPVPSWRQRSNFPLQRTGVLRLQSSSGLGLDRLLQCAVFFLHESRRYVCRFCTSHLCQVKKELQCRSQSKRRKQHQKPKKQHRTNHCNARYHLGATSSRLGPFIAMRGIVFVWLFGWVCSVVPCSDAWLVSPQCPYSIQSR